MYMEEYQNVNGESLVLDLLTHNTNPSTATYHHMCKRFDRYVTPGKFVTPDKFVTVTMTRKKFYQMCPADITRLCGGVTVTHES